MIGEGANLVVAITDLAQGDAWGLVNMLPVVGRAFASTTVGAAATLKFQMLASDVASSTAATFNAAACKLLGQGCFLAGTPVLTDSGPKPIEQIHAGDHVSAYDQATANWALQRVEQPVSFAYAGQIAVIRAGGDTISATALHPFWVISGTDLASRPQPTEVPKADQTFGPSGRWVAAGNLRFGDVLLSEAGHQVSVDSVEFSYENTTVYNLVVDQDHTFAVGVNGLLVHNTVCDFNAIKQLYKDGLIVAEEVGPNGIEFRVQGRRVINWNKAFANGGQVTIEAENAAGAIVQLPVNFKKTGFPNFEPFWYRDNGFKGWVKITYTGTRDGDFTLANKLAKFADTPEGYTWHHSEDLGVMELVRTDAHKAVQHTGGVAIYKAGMRKLCQDQGLPVPDIYN